MDKWTVAVTGDTGNDVYTQYIPDYFSQSDFDVHQQIAYDLEAPSGAELDFFAISSLLRDDHGVEVLDCAPTAATLTQSLQFLKDYEWNERKRVIRISRAAPLKVPKPKPKGGMAFKQERSSADVLVIHDSTEIWRRSKEAREFVASFFKQRRDRSPSAFVILDEERIPDLRVQGDGTINVGGEQSPVWTELLQYKQHVAILCSVSSLRHAGAAISRRLSWELGVEDALADLKHFQPLQALSKFRHLFIRVGFIGALHLERDESGPRPESGQLIFAPSARNAIFADEVKDGRIQGQDSVVAACLLRSLRMRQCPVAALGAGDIADALKSGLTANMCLFDGGFERPADLIESTEDTNILGQKFLQSYFCPEKPRGAQTVRPAEIVASRYDTLITEIPRDRIFGRVELPRAPASVGKAKPWEILRSQVEHRISRVNLGIAICKFGHQQVLNRPIDLEEAGDNRTAVKPWAVKLKDIKDVLTQPECILSANETPDDQPLNGNARVALPHPTDHRPQRPPANPLFVPVFEAGNLVAIERTEIESFRSIQNLMQLYVESQGRAPVSSRPISVAVFGAAGSGKSFAIKQIAKNLNEQAGGSDRLETIECNVAQFRSVEDLGHAITRIASVNNQRKLPLVIFDEFDCSFEDQPLGWLKYFLAPMQDGTFYGASQTITFGRAIFVFTGGVYRTIAEFDPFTEQVGVSAGPGEMESRFRRQAAFRDQKGPDFVSRLRGHINVFSVNPDDTAPKDEEGKPFKPVLRRALVLRGQILEAQLVAPRDGCQVANINNDVLYAFLTVEHYRHGTRSMEAILQMCTPIDGSIETASLPSRTQLNMHVDADDFMARVLRGRYRRFLEPIESGLSQRTPSMDDRGSGGRALEVGGKAAEATSAVLDVKREGEPEQKQSQAEATQT
jgi:hypothetical protein